MGCCFSNSRRPRDAPTRCRSPPRPPPPLEEEAVKEVLSETPLHAESLTPKATHHHQSSPPELQSEKAEVELPKRIQILKLQVEEEEEENDGDVPLPEDSNASEYSELCSVGESFSTATTTAAAERGEVDSDVTSRDYSEVAKIRQRGVRRSSSRIPRKPPVSSSSRSELPRTARSVRGRESCQGRSAQHSVEQIAVGTRNRSELSYQNSRSSAAAKVGGARRSPAKRGGGGGNSSGKTTVGLSGDGNIAKTLLTDEKGNHSKPTTADESLDNPLVSLECFIFL